MHCSALACILGILLATQDASPETSARFGKALQKLGSDEYQEREAASAEIASLPFEAVKLVEAALKNADLELEVRTRLERALPGLQLKGRREIQARKKAVLQTWTHKTVVEAYEQVGRRDPKWDAKAKEALELVSQSWSDPSSLEPNAGTRIYEIAGEAIAAGCDDPMVMYARARQYDTVVRKSFLDSMRMHWDAADAMKKRGAKYPAMRQAFVFARAGQYFAQLKKDHTEVERKDIEGWTALSLARYAEAAKDPTVPESSLVECGEILTEIGRIMAKDRKIAFDRVAAVLAEARPDSNVTLLIKGQVYISYAWDARGGGYANTVTPEGWKLMRERLVEAEVALTRAWEKDPTDAQAPTLMIGVELGQNKGRPSMEKWFRRAMDADPDNNEACEKKMYYLEPKWHGSAEAMLGFGRELLAGGNWDARLPFKLIDAHLTLAGYEDKEDNTYYKNPAVWKDVQAVYVPCLKRRPKSAIDRSWYAKLACWCGQYGEAKEQFAILGDQVDVGAFKDREEMEKLKAEAEAKGR